MELKWLEDFVEIARTGNFSKAAQTRHVTQPALSRRLKSLEEWVGAPLIDRKTYPVTLTAAGTGFQPLAEQIVRDLHHVRQSNRQARTSELHLCMSHALATYFFPRWWRGVVGDRGFVPKILAKDFKECAASLLQKHSHLMLCYDHPSIEHEVKDGDCEFLDVGRDLLVPVCGVAAGGAPLVSISEDAPIPLLSYPHEALLGELVANLIRQLALPVRVRYESALVDALKSQVLLDRGVAWLPLGVVERDLDSGRLVRIGPAAWTMAIDIRLYRRRDAEHPGVLHIWDELQAAAAADSE